MRKQAKGRSAVNPKERLKTKYIKAKKYEATNSGQYIICVLVWAEALSGFMQLYCVLGGHPFQRIENNL